MKMPNTISVMLLLCTLHIYNHEEVKPIPLNISYSVRGNGLISRYIAPYRVPIENPLSYVGFDQQYSRKESPKERAKMVAFHRFNEESAIRSSVFSRLIGLLLFGFFTFCIGKQSVWEPVQDGSETPKTVGVDKFSRTGLCAIGLASIAALDCCLDFFPIKTNSAHENTMAGISLSFTQQGFEAKIML